MSSNLESESSLESSEKETKYYDGTIEYLQEWVPLFYSASWMIRIKVNGKILFESDGKDDPWNEEDMSRWIRGILASNSSVFLNERINVNKEYEEWGGYSF